MSSPTESRSDDDLLAAARLGDAEALEGLILRHQPRVLRFGAKMCGNPEDAGDVAQETLLVMARSLREFRGEASVSTWLYTIARSFCIKKRRRSKFAPAREESLEGLETGQRHELPDPAPGPEQTAFGREVESALAAAIDALDPEQREVLVLRDIEGLTAPEVGQVIGVSVDAVKSRLHRARLAVRQRVAPVLGMSMDSPRSVGCPDVLARFSRYLEGESGPEQCARMEAHLESCGRCRGACESLKRTVMACRATPTPEVPAAVADAVRDAIRLLVRKQTQ